MKFWLRSSLLFLWLGFLLSPVSLWSQSPANGSNHGQNYGITTSLGLEAAPPVTDMGNYIGPLMGFHGQLAWNKLQYSGVLPFLTVDAAYASGQGDIESYYHAGPGLGLSRPFPIRQFDQSFEVSPFAAGGFLWGSIDQGADFALPYASGGVAGAWLIKNMGALRSVDASLGYTHIFSQLTSGYLNIRFGITLGF